MASDKKEILSYLQQHQTITPMEALKKFGCYRLRARVWDLRKEGYNISTTMIYGVDRNGNPSKYALYTLDERELEVDTI